MHSIFQKEPEIKKRTKYEIYWDTLRALQADLGGEFLQALETVNIGLDG